MRDSMIKSAKTSLRSTRTSMSSMFCSRSAASSWARSSSAAWSMVAAAAAASAAAAAAVAAASSPSSNPMASGSVAEGGGGVGAASAMASRMAMRSRTLWVEAWTAREGREPTALSFVKRGLLGTTEFETSTRTSKGSMRWIPTDFVRASLALSPRARVPEEWAVEERKRASTGVTSVSERRTWTSWRAML